VSVGGFFLGQMGKFVKWCLSRGAILVEILSARRGKCKVEMEFKVSLVGKILKSVIFKNTEI
jgi:hypothetical protein